MQPCMHVEDTVHSETHYTKVVYIVPGSLLLIILVPAFSTPSNINHQECGRPLGSCAKILVISATRCLCYIHLFRMPMGHYIGIFHLKIGAVDVFYISTPLDGTVCGDDQPGWPREWSTSASTRPSTRLWTVECLATVQSLETVNGLLCGR